MKSQSRLILWSVVVLALVFSDSSFGRQHDADAETKSEVPELTKFHPVIYKMWHNAWPNKDVEMLKALLPEVQRRGESVCKATLPGILREKRGQWAIAVDTLDSIIRDYQKAVKEDDAQALLDAAERLHMQYEGMVKLVRPPLRELDDFHAVLYPLYHYYKPRKDLGKTREAVDRLSEKMQALNKVVLSGRLKSKESAFADARRALSAAMDTLQEVMQENEWDRIDKQIDNVHTHYEELSRVLE